MTATRWMILSTVGVVSAIEGALGAHFLIGYLAGLGVGMLVCDYWGD